MVKPGPKPKKKTKADYEAVKEESGARRREISRKGRDIAPRPRVKNGRRKAKARKSFRYFCECYFPRTFYLKWSPDHLPIIAKIEKAVKEGGLFAMATPRGFGKTTLCETAALWASFIALHKSVMLIGSSAKHARRMLDHIKAELMDNELLLEDWPEVVYPFHKLAGMAQKATGQLYNDKPTRIQWTAEFVVFPTLPGCATSSGIIQVGSIDAQIRGVAHKRSDGETVRPSLIVLDDPQTDESAKSPMQIDHRMGMLKGAILGLAGVGKEISAILPCTVIQPDDMADQILDRKKHPIWQGERTKLVYEFPTNKKLWAKYEEIRAEDFRGGGDGRKATEFYRKNREAMDEGAKVAWEEHYTPNELSAIQHAMNLLYRDERAFWSEQQNEPMLPEEMQNAAISVEEIFKKLNGIARREIPVGCQTLTAFIDVHKTLLYWTVVAWEEKFTGYVIDYGTYPDQKTSQFTVAGAKRTLALAARGTGLEGSIRAGLEKLTEQILGKEWIRDDGVSMKIDRCLIDANWGQTRNTVYDFCRQSSHAAVITPSHGMGIGAATRPMDQVPKKRGDQVGSSWRIAGKPRATKQVRHAIYDTNFWKSFLVSRLVTAMGDPGCLSLFGRDPKVHQMFAEHLVSEYCEQTEGHGRKVDEWSRRPNAENHWLDCLVGCYVAASIQGIALSKSPLVKKRESIDLAEIQKKNRAEGRSGGLPVGVFQKSRLRERGLF